MARSKLEAEGIECFLADENVIRLNWFRSEAWGRLRLQVLEEQAEKAMEILAQEIPASFSAEEVGEEYNQPRCPKCNSLDVSFQEYNKMTVVFLGLAALPNPWLFALPVPIHRNRWYCEECHNHWQEKDQSLL